MYHHELDGDNLLWNCGGRSSASRMDAMDISHRNFGNIRRPDDRSTEEER